MKTKTKLNMGPNYENYTEIKVWVNFTMFTVKINIFQFIFKTIAIKIYTINSN